MCSRPSGGAPTTKTGQCRTGSVAPSSASSARQQVIWSNERRQTPPNGAGPANPEGSRDPDEGGGTNTTPRTEGAVITRRLRVSIPVPATIHAGQRHFLVGGPLCLSPPCHQPVVTSA